MSARTCPHCGAGEHRVRVTICKTGMYASCAECRARGAWCVGGTEEAALERFYVVRRPATARNLARYRREAERFYRALWVENGTQREDTIIDALANAFAEHAQDGRRGDALLDRFGEG